MGMLETDRLALGPVLELWGVQKTKNVKGENSQVDVLYMDRLLSRSLLISGCHPLNVAHSSRRVT